MYLPYGGHITRRPVTAAKKHTNENYPEENVRVIACTKLFRALIAMVFCMFLSTLASVC